RDRKPWLGLMPLVGTTRYVGPLNDCVTPGLGLGLAVELPVLERFSLELEGGFERASVLNRGFLYEFERAQLGLNLKSYVTRGFFNPYVGAGFHGVRYGGILPDEHLLGAAQAMAGVELALSPSLSLGARVAFTLPVVNLPDVARGAEE